MGQELVFKSKNALTDLTGLPDFIQYKQRVENDGGVIYDEQSTLEAMLFVYKNNIAESDVLSATSVSWGVKYNAETKVISKLYNLFDKSGDIVINSGPSIKAQLEIESGFPALYNRGSNTVNGKSVGTFNLNNPAVFTCHNVPILESYGVNAGTFFPLNHLIDVVAYIADPNPSKSSTNYSGLHHRILRDAKTNNNPLTWNESISFWGGLAALNNNPYSLFSGYAGCASEEGIQVFKDGVLMNSKNKTGAIPGVRKTNQQLYFLTHISNSGNPVSEYYLGYIFENWILNNSTVDIAKALSLRAKKYRD